MVVLVDGACYQLIKKESIALKNTSNETGLSG
jgi:hypothetical protein